MREIVEDLFRFRFILLGLAVLRGEGVLWRYSSRHLLQEFAPDFTWLPELPGPVEAVVVNSFARLHAEHKAFVGEMAKGLQDHLHAHICRQFGTPWEQAAQPARVAYDVEIVHSLWALIEGERLPKATIRAFLHAYFDILKRYWHTWLRAPSLATVEYHREERAVVRGLGVPSRFGALVSALCPALWESSRIEGVGRGREFVDSLLPQMQAIVDGNFRDASTSDFVKYYWFLRTLNHSSRPLILAAFFAELEASLMARHPRRILLDCLERLLLA